jgi:hypothetical protein
MSLDIEKAMYPNPCRAPLTRYELYLGPNTGAKLSSKSIPTAALHILRISGSCHLDRAEDYGNLEHITLAGVKGAYFELAQFRALLPLRLRSFTYAHGDNMSYELRDQHLLEFVTKGAAQSTLTTLIMLGCTRLSTSTISECLKVLPQLEYLALSLVISQAHDISPEFMYTLPPKLHTFKLQIQLTRWAPRCIVPRRAVLDAVESQLLLRAPPPRAVWIAENGGMAIGEHEEIVRRWRDLASASYTQLRIGPWEELEHI